MIKFVVLGRPVPKQRPRMGKGKAFTAQLTKDYEKTVGWYARAAMMSREPLQGPVAATIDVYHKNKMDCDNMAKSILDGLNGICYLDDDQVVELLVRKHTVSKKNDERAEVEIREAG